MSLHWNDDRLIDRLYGVAEEDEHLRSCEACQARWEEVQLRRRSIAVAEPVSPALLHRQREQIERRIERPTIGWVWAPAAAALLLIAGVASVQPDRRPANVAKAEQAAVLEAGWFEDSYSSLSELEPRAVSPIRGLFAEQPVLE